MPAKAGKESLSLGALEGKGNRLIIRICKAKKTVLASLGPQPGTRLAAHWQVSGGDFSYRSLFVAETGGMYLANMMSWTVDEFPLQSSL